MTTQAVVVPPIIVFRGCRQYPFFSVARVRKWARHPAYGGEMFGARVIDPATRRTVAQLRAIRCSDLAEALEHAGAPA